MQRWYLVRSKPNAEALACRNLDRQGYGTYLPRLAQSLPWRGGWRERIVPLFPGYLFLGLDEGRQPLAPARSTPGVAGLVRFGDEYAVVPDAILGALRGREHPGTGLHALAMPENLARGTAVAVIAGPFDGLEGVFQRRSGTDRAIVLLSVLGQSASVAVPVGSLLPRRAA